MKGRRGNPGLCGKLLDKGVEAYILALETINRLSIQYRVETFTYLICNTWELLLKARMLDQTKNPRSRNNAFRTPWTKPALPPSLGKRMVIGRRSL